MKIITIFGILCLGPLLTLRIFQKKILKIYRDPHIWIKWKNKNPWKNTLLWWNKKPWINKNPWKNNNPWYP